MTAGTVTRPQAAAAVLATGVVTGGTAGLTAVHGLAGGAGAVRWKTLAEGAHLAGGGWKSAAYCEIPPGAGIGRPLRVEAGIKICYVLSGEAVMTVGDLEDITVSTGQLVTCSASSVHGIRVPAGAAQPAAFFMAEVFPGRAVPARAVAQQVSMTGKLDWCEGYRGGGHGQETRVAVAGLTRHQAGPGQRFSLIEMQPGETLAYRLPRLVSELLFVAGGTAEITAAGVSCEGGPGTFTGTPLAARVTIRNRSTDKTLTVISTEVAA